MILIFKEARTFVKVYEIFEHFKNFVEVYGRDNYLTNARGVLTNITNVMPNIFRTFYEHLQITFANIRKRIRLSGNGVIIVSNHVNYIWYKKG